MTGENHDLILGINMWSKEAYCRVCTALQSAFFCKDLCSKDSC